MSKFAENTRVPVAKTRAEIERTLERFGATSFAYFADPDKAMVAFAYAERNVRFDLRLKKQSEFRTIEGHDRDLRERWRALLLSIKARLSSVESGIESFESAFMSHVVMPDGRTVAEHALPRIADAYAGRNVPLLPSSEKHQ